MYKRHILQMAVSVFTVILMSVSAWAVPGLINYQGKLTDPDGISLDGYYIMGFYLYNAETGGSHLWSEQQDIAVTNGIYNVELGKTSSFSSDLFDNENLYLEVRIFSTSTGWETFSPRERITSTAFAMKAGDADTLDGYDSTDLAATNHTHNGEDITSGIIDETYIDQTITRDSELAAHAAAPSAHHSKTTSFSEMTDMATDNQIPDDITVNHAKDSDRVDGKHASEFGDGYSLDAADGNPVDAVYVNVEGNVGIGTVTPQDKLHIYENKNDFVGIMIDNPNTGSFSSEGIYFGDENGSFAGIRLHDDGSASYPSQISIFNNRPGGSITFSTQGFRKMVLNNSGNLGIGTTSPSYKLHVNGTAYATGAAGALSDRRDKMNISYISFDALEVVKDLHPVTFEWKEPQDSGMEGTQLGFIAQEVEEVLPEAVLTQDNEEQTKGLKYNALIPLLTKAIQELDNQNEILKAENETLKAENNILRHEIEKIKEAIGLL